MRSLFGEGAVSAFLKNPCQLHNTKISMKTGMMVWEGGASVEGAVSKLFEETPNYLQFRVI